ncbi:MAG: hypothetical protein HN341_16405 [Verrucomicrobia bacterium]|jgi:hypothetical protein|nr:hypothetical protein [Verrucomicrobiota bacterium]
MSRLRYGLITALCALVLASAPAEPITRLASDVGVALSAVNQKRRVRAIERVRNAEGSVRLLTRELREGSPLRRAKLAAILGCVADTVTLSGLLLQPDLVAESSLAREVLATAFLEKLLAALEGHAPASDSAVEDQHVLAVVDACYTDPNWRIRQIAARLLRAIDSTNPTPAFIALAEDSAWPVQSHIVRTPVPSPEKLEVDAPQEFMPRGPEEAIRTLSLLDALYGGDAEALQMPIEVFQYRVRAKWGILPLPSGTMQQSVTTARRHGVPCYHLRQRIAVAGRYQDEDAYIDADGLFPYEYRVSMRRPTGGRCRHVVLWDHIGGKIHLHKVKGRGKPRLEEWEMGVDEPFDSRDPLSAMVLFRQMCAEATNAIAWKANVLLTCDERYEVRAEADAGISEAGGTVRWHWVARNCKEPDRTVRSRLGSAPEVAPLSYATRAWGVKGSAELIVPPVHSAPVPPDRAPSQ